MRMRGAAFKIMTLWGIPVRVHFTLLLTLPVLVWAMGGIEGVWVALALFGSIVLHELGHALVARRKGCVVREILLLPIGGAAQIENLPTRPMDEFLMAIAGPLVSFGLCLLLTVGGGYLPLARHWPMPGAAGGTINVVQALGLLNLSLGLFNLIPAFPMDGGRVLRAVLVPRLGRLRATRVAMRVGRVLAVAFIALGLYAWSVVPMLVVIGAFIFWAAGVEYRIVRRQEMQADPGWEGWPFGARRPDDPDRVIVSPSPYRDGSEEKITVRVERRRSRLFDDLFRR
jgi:Zn-dependent protease